MSGLWGKILRVDLSNSTIAEETIPNEWLKKFLGGRGLAARYLIEEVPKGADPLGRQNKLIFMAGLLTGVPSPTANKNVVVAKSPLTGIFGTSIAGGTWAAKLKKSGIDGIIFQGVSPKPVYLVIDDGAVELRDAGHLWGKNVFETCKIVHDELGEAFGVACIGIGGENLVKYACVVDNEERAAGRCGLGAVMGSKLLKAVAVKGTKMVPIADKETFKETEKKHYARISSSIVKMMQEAFGTTVAIDKMNVQGFLPHKNWQTSQMPNAHNISGGQYKDKILSGTEACFACPIKCTRRIEVRKGKFAGVKGRGPEYETIGVWGSLVNFNDIEAVAAAQSLCSDYGLDTMSCGSTIAFAMECYERGIITKAETGGLELNFGNIDAALELIPKIARREGFGDLLAEGTRIMSQRLDKGTESFAMHVKGLELPMYECRGAKIVGLAYAVGSRGGCHNMADIQLAAISGFPIQIVEKSSIPDPLVANPAQVTVLKDLEDAGTVIDCVGTCKFVMGMTSSFQDVLSSVTNTLGYEFTLEEYKKLGERVYNVERVFNVREGITRADDTLPKRLLEEPLKTGIGVGQTAKIDTWLDTYYELRGWDKDGKPTQKKLQDLGLEDIVKHLN